MNLHNARYLLQDSSIVLWMVDTFQHYILFDLADLLKVHNIQQMHQHTKSVQSMADMFQCYRLIDRLYPSMGQNFQMMHPNRLLRWLILFVDCMSLLNKQFELFGLLNQHNVQSRQSSTPVDQPMVGSILFDILIDLPVRLKKHSFQATLSNKTIDHWMVGMFLPHKWIGSLDL